MTTAKVLSPDAQRCEPELIALARDPRTGEEFDIFSCLDRRGEPRLVPVPSSAALGAERGVLEVLHAANVPFPRLRARQAAFVAAMDAQTTERRMTVASRPGWLGRRFALPHRVHGPGTGRVLLRFPPEAPSAGARPRGTLAGWQAGVAAPARGNHVLVFAVCLALAAPLLRLLGLEGGGFQLVAPSSLAKSTAAAAGASVWGLEAEGVLRTWSGTANRFDEVAEFHNDLLLVLDEARLAGRNTRERAEMLADVAFRLASGRKRGRLGEAERGRVWLVLLLSTSERTCAEIARLGGVELVEGQLARLTDIVLPWTRVSGVLQDLHGTGSLGAFGARLWRAARRNRGVAGEAYLERLVAEADADRAGLVRRLRARMARYLEGAGTRGPVDERVGRRFALAYAAGCLAAGYEVLPYTRAEILAAVRYCHRHARIDAEAVAPAPRGAPTVDEAGDGGDERLELLVAEYVARRRAAFLDLRHFRGASPLQMRAAPGFLRERQNGELELLLLPAKFRQAVCGGRDPRAVVEALRRHDLIRLDQGGKTTIPRDLPPPLGRKRVVCIKGEILRLAAGKE
jgi:putative DNA primase/helicase